MQSVFADALLDPERAPPPGLRVADAAERFAVYRNNVVSGLSRALAAGFPAVEAIVGTEFFAAMAALFVRRHLPQSPVLLDYGTALPDFLQTFAPAAELPYLADVARLELAYTRAFHAADAMPLPPETLGRIAATSLAALRLRLHPSLQVLCAAYPVATIWAMNTGRAPLTEITDWSGEDILVLRPQLTVDVIVLAPGEATFLLALQAGETLEAAASAALACSDDTFNLGAALAALFTRGAVTTLDPSAQDRT